MSEASPNAAPAAESPRASSPLIATIIRIDPRAQSCIVERHNFIQLYRNTGPFGPVNWDANRWEVSEALRSTIKGYKSRHKANIVFTRHRTPGQREGDPFPETDGLRDVIKAWICRQHSMLAVTETRHMVYLRAWRYVVDAMTSTDVAQLTPSVFNAAAFAVGEREKPSTAYTVHGCLEHIADTLDELHLTKVKLSWRWSKKRRPPAHGGSKHKRLLAAAEVDRRAPDEVVFAVAKLYHIVPQSAWGDRVCVLLTVILVCTGLRLGQVLCLRAEMPQYDEETAEHFIRLVPFKGKPAQRKVLLSQTVDLLKEVFHELLDLTEPAREVARWLARNPGKAFLPKPDGAHGTVSAATLARWFGLPLRRMEKRLEDWGFSGTAVSLQALNSLLVRDRFDAPVVPGTGHSKLLLQDCLSIGFKSQVKQKATALIHAVRPINEQNMTDRLRGRQGSRKQPTMFERYGIRDKKGEPISANSHSFRHKLNDTLDNGGAPDIIQAQWFGRANVRDNQAYQYRTAEDMRERARALLVQGKLEGPLASLLQAVAPERRIAAAESMIQVAHPVVGGYCFLDFAQGDCPHSGQCFNDCKSFHWAPSEEERKSELVAKSNFVSNKLKVMLAGMANAGSQSDESLEHLRHQLRSVNRILQSIERAQSEAPHEG